jgi:hypothetical protein
MPYTTDAPYRIRLWTPFTGDYEDATTSIELKAPEIGNSEKKARNQSMVRTRGGTTLVYDRGRNYNEFRRFEFRAIKNVEKAALEVFLEAVQWGTTKLKYKDWMDNEYVIRINTTELEYVDTGLIDHNRIGGQSVLWDFDLEFIDLTNNSDELEGSDAVVSSAISLHLQDYNHPHNPRTTATVGTTLTTVETFLVDSWDLVSWLTVIVSGANKAYGIISATHNGTSGADATTTDMSLQVLSDPVGLFNNITFTVDLNGTTTAQTMRLRGQAASGSHTVKVRRLKL